MYALSIATDGRILHATLPGYASSGAAIVAKLPDGDISDYRYVNGCFNYDPLPGPELTEPDDDVADLAAKAAAYDILMGGITE